MIGNIFLLITQVDRITPVLGNDEFYFKATTPEDPIELTVPLTVAFANSQPLIANSYCC